MRAVHWAHRLYYKLPYRVTQKVCQQRSEIVGGSGAEQSPCCCCAPYHRASYEAPRAAPPHTPCCRRHLYVVHRSKLSCLASSGKPAEHSRTYVLYLILEKVSRLWPWTVQAGFPALRIFSLTTLLLLMVIRVFGFSSGGYKIGKIFYL